METYCGFETLVAAEQHMMALADLSRRKSPDQLRNDHSTSSMERDSTGPHDRDAADIRSVTAIEPLESD